MGKEFKQMIKQLEAIAPNSSISVREQVHLVVFGANGIGLCRVWKAYSDQLSKAIEFCENCPCRRSKTITVNNFLCQLANVYFIHNFLSDSQILLKVIELIAYMKVHEDKAEK